MFCIILARREDKILTKTGPDFYNLKWHNKKQRWTKMRYDQLICQKSKQNYHVNRGVGKFLLLFQKKITKQREEKKTKYLSKKREGKKTEQHRVHYFLAVRFDT